MPLPLLQGMVFPTLLASLQRTQLVMELSVMSLTSQMNYVSFIAVQSNIIHGSICSVSLQTNNSAVSLTSLAVTLHWCNIYMCTYEPTICSACYLIASYCGNAKNCHTDYIFASKAFSTIQPKLLTWNTSHPQVARWHSKYVQHLSKMCV